MTKDYAEQGVTEEFMRNPCECDYQHLKDDSCCRICNSYTAKIIYQDHRKLIEALEQAKEGRHREYARGLAKAQEIINDFTGGRT